MTNDKLAVREVLGEIGGSKKNKKIKKASLTVRWGFCTFHPKPISYLEPMSSYIQFHKLFEGFLYLWGL